MNLTEAQHVILVEPQLHQSVELQAIARVRRLGQKYNTYVYRVNCILNSIQNYSSFFSSLLWMIRPKKLSLQIPEQHKQLH